MSDSLIALTFQSEAPAACGESIDTLVAEGFASRLFDRDPTLWGPEAEEESSKRLGWTQSATHSAELVDEILALRQEFADQGLDRIVLCGMGGSSLAPEVICHAAKVDLVVLDSSDPDMVRSTLVDLDRTVVVVSSKSGGTVETDSQRRAFVTAFQKAEIDPTDRIVVVTDPGSPLETAAKEAGFRVFLADPNVGGRYSALTAFGLVPSGLAGAPIADLLDQAQQVTELLASDSVENPGLQLGSLLGSAANLNINKLVLADASRIGLGDWIEQLVAESTGKHEKGILPVVVAGEDSPNFAQPSGDSVLVSTGTHQLPAAESAAAVQADLGAQFLLWEVATAAAGRLIGINPFDQPDVESAKQASRDLLGASNPTASPDAVDGDIELFGTEAENLDDALESLFNELTSAGYIAVQVYLDRWNYSSFESVRDSLAEVLRRPVTFGWGPRFLHSTGQFHKGGVPNGVFLQITGEPIEDLDIEGREFSFGGFISAQAAGDAQVLREHGRPVLQLHLRDIPAGLDRIAQALS